MQPDLCTHSRIAAGPSDPWQLGMLASSRRRQLGSAGVARPTATPALGTPPAAASLRLLPWLISMRAAGWWGGGHEPQCSSGSPPGEQAHDSRAPAMVCGGKKLRRGRPADVLLPGMPPALLLTDSRQMFTGSPSKTGTATGHSGCEHEQWSRCDREQPQSSAGWRGGEGRWKRRGSVNTMAGERAERGAETGQGQGETGSREWNESEWGAGPAEAHTRGRTNGWLS